MLLPIAFVWDSLDDQSKIEAVVCREIADIRPDQAHAPLVGPCNQRDSAEIAMGHDHNLDLRAFARHRDACPIDVFRSSLCERRADQFREVHPRRLPAPASTEALLVELLQLRVGAPEVAARRRDIAVSRQALRGRDVRLRRPRGDRGVSEPVR